MTIQNFLESFLKRPTEERKVLDELLNSITPELLCEGNIERLIALLQGLNRAHRPDVIKAYRVAIKENLKFQPDRAHTFFMDYMDDALEFNQLKRLNQHRMRGFSAEERISSFGLRSVRISAIRRKCSAVITPHESSENASFDLDLNGLNVEQAVRSVSPMVGLDPTSNDVDLLISEVKARMRLVTNDAGRRIGNMFRRLDSAGWLRDGIVVRELDFPDLLVSREPREVECDEACLKSIANVAPDERTLRLLQTALQFARLRFRSEKCGRLILQNGLDDISRLPQLQASSPDERLRYIFCSSQLEGVSLFDAVDTIRRADVTFRVCVERLTETAQHGGDGRIDSSVAIDAFLAVVAATPVKAGLPFETWQTRLFEPLLTSIVNGDQDVLLSLADRPEFGAPNSDLSLN